jgi:Flavin reductase like domain
LRPDFLSRVASRKIELNADLLPKKGVSFVSHRETPFSGKQAERIEVMLLCRIVAEVPGGTHSVFLAEVEAAQAKEGMPLTYFRGRMGHFVKYPKF